MPQQIPQPETGFDLKAHLTEKLERLKTELKEFEEREDLWEAREKFREIFTQIFEASEVFGITVDSVDKLHNVALAYKAINERTLAELEKIGIDTSLEKRFLDLEDLIVKTQFELEKLGEGEG